MCVLLLDEGSFSGSQSLARELIFLLLEKIVSKSMYECVGNVYIHYFLVEATMITIHGGMIYTSEPWLALSKC